jgi:hypothetical protein
MTDDAARRALDLDAIHQLKARYCRFIDTKQWDLLASVFTQDARFEGLGSAPTGATVEMFVTGISTRFANVVSIHHCHMPEINFLGLDRARGIWAMMDYVEWAEGAGGPHEAQGFRGFTGYGHYEEAYHRTADGWRIAFLRLTRLRIDPLLHPAPPPTRTLIPHMPDWLTGA